MVSFIQRCPILSIRSWSYREHDKGPEEFSSVLMKLLAEEVDFRVSILGSHTNDLPGTVNPRPW